MGFDIDETFSSSVSPLLHLSFVSDPFAAAKGFKIDLQCVESEDEAEVLSSEDCGEYYSI